MPPSDSATCRSGNLRSTGDHSRSAAAWTMLIGCSVMSTSIGASRAVITSRDDEPMCRHTIVPSSTHACQNGSQCASWKLGSFRCDGFSENETAWQPFAALRRTSAAIASGSQIGGSISGMKRPGAPPHHSSMCQSLYACRTARPASRSDERLNSCPHRFGNDGKHIEPITPFASMSSTRSAKSKQPERISSNDVGSMPYSSGGRPATAFSPMFGISFPS